MLNEVLIPPKSASSCSFGIDHCRPNKFDRSGIVLFLWIHEFTIRLLVPPGVAEVRIHEEISLMHVAVHALAGWYRASELMNDGMALLVLRNRRIVGEAESLMSELAPPAGIGGRTIVCINDMTSRTTAGSIIARMIVRSQKT